MREAPGLDAALRHEVTCSQRPADHVPARRDAFAARSVDSKRFIPRPRNHPSRSGNPLGCKEEVYFVWERVIMGTCDHLAEVLKQLPHNATPEQAANLTPARIAAERKAKAEAVAEQVA